MNEALKEKTNRLFYAFMKEARRQSFMEFLEEWEISYEEFEEIEEFFSQFGIKFG